MASLDDVAISDIKVGKRFRKDMGDIDGLSESITSLGLLQPIGVSKDKELIFGERRLRAVKKLKWDKIPCYVIDLAEDLYVQAEDEENSCHKQFTRSERVAIMKAKRKEIGNRHGKRSDLDPAVAAGETRVIAAQEVGFSEQEARRAEAVVDNAEPEIIKAMDTEALSVNAAACAATLPAPAQRKVAQAAEEIGKMAAVQELKKQQESLVARKGTTMLQKALSEGKVLLSRAAALAARPAGEQVMTLNELYKELGKRTEPNGNGKKKKNGAAVFDDRLVITAAGKLTTLLHKRTSAIGKSVEQKACLDAMEDVFKTFKKWQAISK